MNIQSTEVGAHVGIDLINKLAKVPGACTFLGECSTQVSFRLKNGKVLRFGVTDDDVAEKQGLWFDMCEINHLEGLEVNEPNDQQTDL